MSKKKLDKKNFLKASFGSVLVCEKNSYRPFLENFVQEPENLAQQNLGTLAGIFEITDYSEDSSYIVNYLISMIKKEYYSRIKRSSIESFEAALHKANLALAKLAEHGSTGWIGKINAILLVIEKNNIYLSQTGEAHAFLLRSKKLTNITENPAREKIANPLKTFTDVIGGKLESGDKLIIAEQSIFDIFSLEELKRSALKFSPAEFIQFLKTALVNELEHSSALVADITEKIEVVPEKTSRRDHPTNVFSQDAFSKIPASAKKPINSEEKEILVGEINQELEKEKGEFVDKKTGHIYIKEGQFLKKDTSSLSDFIETGQVKLAGFLPLFAKIKSGLAPRINHFRQNYKMFSLNIMKITFNQIKKVVVFTAGAIISGFRFITPKIKSVYLRLDNKQRLYAILIILIIILVPYFYVKFSDGNEEKENAPQEAMVNAPVPLERDKNVSRIENLNTVYEGNNILEIINLGGKIFAAGAGEIINLESQENHPAPDDFKPVKIAAGMDNLNLIFILNEKNAILSWSPSAKKFQENQFNLPENSSPISIKSYLTYLYVLDKSNHQIYRYPRAEGGFGVQVNWLKENTDLSKIKDMAVSDNVYLAGEDEILKFYRGKKQDFQIESSSTAFGFDKVYANKDLQNIYFLDKANSRIVKLDLNGNILAQYYHSEISNAQNFIVDETANLIYFAAPGGVKSFEM